MASKERPGWIPIHRRIFGSDVWRYPDKRFVALFVAIVGEAAWEDRVVDGVRLRRGQLLTTSGTLAGILNALPSAEFFEVSGLSHVHRSAWKVSRRQVQRWIEILTAIDSIRVEIEEIRPEKATGGVAQDSERDRGQLRGQNKGQRRYLITVVNYERYAVRAEDSGQDSGQDSSELGGRIGGNSKKKRRKKDPTTDVGGEEGPLSRRRFSIEELESKRTIDSVPELLAFFVEYGVESLSRRPDSDRLPKKPIVPTGNGVVGIAKKILGTLRPHQIPVAVRRYFAAGFPETDFEAQRRDGYPSLSNFLWAAPRLISKPMLGGEPKESPSTVVDRTGGLVRRGGRWVDPGEGGADPAGESPLEKPIEATTMCRNHPGDRAPEDPPPPFDEEGDRP